MALTHRGAALVTGCSTGIGRAAAVALAGKGFQVYATARNVASISALASGKIVTLALDVTDDASMVAAVTEIERQHGHVTVLVNNAGYAIQGPVEETPLTDIRTIFETNVIGLTRLTQLVLPGMRAAGSGRVINVSSMAGRITFPGGAFYHATKHAVEAISDAMRLELRPFGIRVVVVQPGPVRTSFADTAMDSLGGAAGPYQEFRAQLAGTYASAYAQKNAGVLSPERVARVIAHAAATSRPRARYAVGFIARALMTLRRVTPDVVWDAFARAQFPVPASPAPATPAPVSPDAKPRRED